MATFESIVQGETDTLEGFTLKSAGAAFDLTNYDVVPAFTNAAGTPVATQGTVTKQTQSGGTVGKIDYAPHAADFTRSSDAKPREPEHFGIRWKVTHTSTGKIKYFPSGAPDILPVYAP